MKKNLYIIIVAVIFSIILWISISLSNEYYTTIKVPLKIINFPSGFATGTDIPNYISVKLKGKGWKLISLTWGREEDYVISAARDTGRKFVNISNYSTDNQWLSSDVEIIDINPDTLSYNIEKISAVKAAIIPDLDLDFKAGFGLASKIKISPESTVVYGPVSIVENLKAVKTEKLKLNNLDDKFNDKIKLAPLPGTSFENSFINLNLDVQKVLEKDFNNVEVTVSDIPTDRDVVLIPNKIRVGLRGGVDVLASLSDNKIKANVNYRDVVLDTLGSVAPHVEAPGNTDLIFVKPERLRYIIKKFN